MPFFLRISILPDLSTHEIQRSILFMPIPYIFKSDRLGFRAWAKADIEKMAEINGDKEVMEFFPGVKTYDETVAFIGRMQRQLLDKGYCYFALDKLDDGELIGFIGVSDQVFEASFTPCVDIGWRLSRKEWGKGFATEGAKRCLQYAFEELRIGKVYAMAPVINISSEQVMRKIGMKKLRDFVHPLLSGNDRLKQCALYEISRTG